MTVVVGVVAAGRKRGKTALIESLTRFMSKKLKVWTIKHVSDSFDTQGKDTWRHLKAGAVGTIAATKDQLVILRRINQPTLDAALGEVPRDVDLILVEGFRGSQYPKILVTTTLAEAKAQLQQIRGIFAIYGLRTKTGLEKTVDSIPIFSEKELKDRLNEMVVKNKVKRLPNINCRKCGYPTCEALAQAIIKGESSLEKCKTLRETDLVLRVDGRVVYMREFPRTFVKNVLLSMVGTLKGVDRAKMGSLSIEVKV